MGVVLAQFDVHTAGWQMGEQVPWLGGLGLNYALAVDGLSLPLLGLNSLVLLLVLASEPPVVRPRLYYSLVLLTGAAVAGAFLAQNLLLFFLFYEWELLPLYLLIAIWGGGAPGLCGDEVFGLYGDFGIAVAGGFFWLSGTEWGG